MTERVPVGPPAILIDRDVEATMRDGVVLRSDVYRPEKSEGLPVILMRVPYGKSKAQTQSYAHPIWYASHGYVVVIQDTRGRGSSDGVFYPFLNEMEDGFDSVEWAAGLPNANGRVGMYGFSYPGATQLLASVTRPPHLCCIAPGMTTSQYYEGWTYRNGALSLAFVVSWALSLASDDALKRGDFDAAAALKQARGAPMPHYQTQSPRDIPLLDEQNCEYFQDWLDHPTYDSYWKRWSIDELYDRIAVPVLNFGGWYDSFKDGTVRNFAGLRDADGLMADQNHLVMGPWFHMPWMSSLNNEDFGPDAASDIDALQLSWFDRWLKLAPVEEDASDMVRIFVMGRNKWESFSDWPPRETVDTTLYLDGPGRANSADGKGSLSVGTPSVEAYDVYAYDPSTPVQSLGGHSCCNSALTPMGPKDQGPVELQMQMLVYDTAPLESELLVSGPVRAHVWVASSAVDTDFVAKLVDVQPDGRAINICEGILRMSYREGSESRVLMEPWDIYEVSIDLGHTCNAFLPGHRIRLEITSSCFPQWDRNYNTGEWSGGGVSPMTVATQLVFRGPTKRSSLVLRTLSPETADAESG